MSYTINPNIIPANQHAEFLELAKMAIASRRGVRNHGLSLGAGVYIFGPAGIRFEIKKHRIFGFNITTVSARLDKGAPVKIETLVKVVKALSKEP